MIFQAKMTLRAIGPSDPAVSHEQRRAIAQRFIELDDKLRDIDEHCRGLELAQKLRPEWTARLVVDCLPSTPTVSDIR